MSNHFKLTSETTENIFGTTLFRIELTIDCKWGKVGDKGGFIEKEENVYGDAWVSGNARVSGDAQVSGDAWVSGNARVSGDAQVSGNAWVSGDAWKKSPLQIQGSVHFVCETKIGFLKIGCIEHKTDFWVKEFEAIGANNNYTAEQIQEYGLYIELAAKIQKINLGKNQ
jgi:hypothetical protein